MFAQWRRRDPIAGVSSSNYGRNFAISPASAGKARLRFVHLLYGYLMAAWWPGQLLLPEEVHPVRDETPESH
jgi:hypothetical protein